MPAPNGQAQSEKPADGVLVELVICNDLVNTTAVAYDANGKVIDLPARIEIRPQFLSPTGLVGIARCKVLAVQNGVPEEKGSSMCRLSGVNGKMNLEAIMPQMLPKFLLPKVEPKPKKPDTPAEPPKTN